MNSLLEMQKKLASNDFLSGLDTSSEATYQLDDPDYNKAMLYPYFYSMYLYEPALLEGETIDTQYSKGNWYAPSMGELALAMYCRGLSVSEAFTSANINSAINTKAVREGAIFTKALNRMGSDFPSVWADLISVGNNITTNVNTTETDNYGYILLSSSGSVEGSWYTGCGPYDVSGKWEAY
jgi:hypothetical protein